MILAVENHPVQARGARRLEQVLVAWIAVVASLGTTFAAEGLAGQALAPRSGPRGSTMFTEMPAAVTGVVVDNRYADPKMWSERREEFKFGAIGTGVTAGDFDQDGRPDLFVVSKTEQSRLFRNLGGWKFEDVTRRAGLEPKAGALDEGMAWLKRSVGQDAAPPPSEAWVQGATFVDVDNDGWLDLYVCRFNAPNLLYINQRDGTFKEEAAAHGLAVADASGMAAFCDYDRDGWLDVYVSTNILSAETHPAGQRDYLFHNDGNGHFTDVTVRAGIVGENQAHSATWWDYDNDGWPDLYVANDFAIPDSLYHNNRDGTFTNRLNQTVPHTPHSSMGADLGDVNNDGLIDFFVADMATTSHATDMRGMAKIRALLTGMREDPAVAPQMMRNALYLNTATGRMLEAAHLAGLQATDWTWSPRFEDLDNDGRLDLYVTNGMVRELHNVDLNQRISATESIAEGARVMKTSPVLAETHLAFRNRGDLQFENAGSAWGLDRKGVSFGSAFADFDGDGDLDIVYANYQSGPTLLRNDSETGHRLTIALRGTRSNRFGVGATVRIESATAGVQVRQLVLARGYNSSSEPIVHFGLGEDVLVKRLTVVWPSGETQVFTDVPADRRLTITEPVAASLDRAAVPPAAPAQFTEVSRRANLSVTSREADLPETGSPAFLPVRQNRRGPALAIADLNGDGRDDAVVGGTTLDPARVLVRAGEGTFGEPSALSVGPAGVDDGPLVAFDADGDGTNDLLVTKGGANRPSGAPEYQPELWLNDGHGHFRPAAESALPALHISAGAAVVADFDRDGRLDVFIGARVLPGEYPLPPRSALLANHGGAFVDVTETLAPGLADVGLVTSALWTDVDGDGWLDLLLTLEWGGVKCFRNDHGRGFVDVSDRLGFGAAGTGWWCSLAAADFNGDGQPDYVAGNVGLNTPYRASADRPALLFRGDFGASGGPLLVEGHYEGDRLYPRRSRNEFATKIPSLMKRFARNDAYARATLGEIFGEDRLAQARRFAATEFRSGVFLSQANGTFRFEALPRIAQIAPLQGIVAGDFDGDGHADIYAVQNSYAPVAVVGRFDGGLSQLLSGDGHGHFTPATPAASGLVVPGDAKALVAVDLDADGWADFVVSRNNGTTLAFRNTGVTGRRSLAVQLQGLAGNPSGVGARVTAELADGTTQTSELYAGSSFYSQSTAAVFFGFPEANPPRRLIVRWPYGATTTHVLASTPSTIRLTAPR